MLIWQLNNSWQVNVYNENHPAAFYNFRLLDHETVAQLVSKSQTLRTLFKPILDPVQSNLLLARFPLAKLLFPIRNFDDVVNSSLKKFGVYNRIGHVRRWMEDDFAEFAVAPPPEKTKERIRKLWNPQLGPESGAALYWLFYNQLYQDMGLAEDERVLLVHYEMLVTKPHAHFQRIVNHLDIELEDCMVDGVFASSIGRDSRPPIDPAIRKACEALYAELSAMVTCR